MSIAIRVEHLSKEYRLGVINHGMLYKDMQSWLARKLGRPDPHGQIGVDHFADRKDRFWALKDLCFDIQQGDRVGIIGRNGAGKSTLLKILSRITAPTEGTVRIKGRVASLLEVGTGFHGELTGRENVYLNGAILGMKRHEISRKLDEIIDFAEIAMFIDTPVKRYSSGMYVRLAFAVAANLDSEIMIADEVLAVGDAAFQKKALGKMSALSNSEGKTVLFVSHNINAVKQLCNMGMVLENGRNRPILSIEQAVQYYANSTETGVVADVAGYKRNSACSLRAKIIGFRVVTSEGENTGKINSEERVVVRFLVESYYDDVRAAFQLWIAHAGQNIAMFDSGHLKNQSFKLDKGQYELECEIAKLNLYAGTYSMSIGLDIPAIEQIDYIPDAYSFEIPFYDPAGTGHNLHIDNNWGIFSTEHEYRCDRLR